MLYPRVTETAVGTLGIGKFAYNFPLDLWHTGKYHLANPVARIDGKGHIGEVYYYNTDFAPLSGGVLPG